MPDSTISGMAANPICIFLTDVLNTRLVQLLCVTVVLENMETYD